MFPQVFNQEKPLKRLEKSSKLFEKSENLSFSLKATHISANFLVYYITFSLYWLQNTLEAVEIIRTSDLQNFYNNLWCVAVLYYLSYQPVTY